MQVVADNGSRVEILYEIAGGLFQAVSALVVDEDYDASTLADWSYNI